MMRMDIHRPSVIEPADYEFVAFEYLKVEDLGDAFVLQANREQIQRHMAKTGGRYSSHAHGGNCHVCGAHCVYTALFYHKPTNTYIRTGLDCGEKLDMGDAEKFRKTIQNVLEAQACKKKAMAVLKAAGLDAAWEVYNATHEPAYEENTIKDIVRKLVMYGSISEAQKGFLQKLLDRIATRDERLAKQKAETEAALPVPISDNRMVIRGKVLTIREVDTDYGRTFKTLVKHKDGWKVWGTLPTKGMGVKVGDEIEFKARVTRSQDDPKFGFFSRPTNGQVIASIEEHC